LANISEKCERIFVKISSETYLWIRNDPLNLGSHPDPDLIRRGGGLRSCILCFVKKELSIFVHRKQTSSCKISETWLIYIYVL